MPLSLFFLKLQRNSNKIRNKKVFLKVCIERKKKDIDRSIDRSRDVPSFEEKSATR